MAERGILTGDTLIVDRSRMAGVPQLLDKTIGCLLFSMRAPWDVQLWVQLFQQLRSIELGSLHR